MVGVLARLLCCARGATAIEYSLIAALVAVVMLAGLQVLGASMEEAFAYIAQVADEATGR
jgi:Flp pilus assembly pilin Flp